MEGVKTFWLVNSIYEDVKEFHFTSSAVSFVVYVRDDRPIFVLDNTCDDISPNNMLFIEPMPEDWGKRVPDTKWDAILQNKFNIDSMKIRPKENTKYKKLDINYIDLDIYAQFIQNQSDDLLQAIIYNREDLSLENAYMREGESLIQYNKSTQTIKTASSAVELLKTRILNVSKRLNRIEEQFEASPEQADEELKQRVTQKLYDNTEKLKRAERRLKRATKRADIAFNDLSLKRYQIQEIKNRIASRSVQVDSEDSHPLYQIPSDVEMTIPQYHYDYSDEKSSQNQNVTDGTTDELTIKNLSAKNNQGEEVDIAQSLKKEAIMARETENKNTNQTTEFQPPYVDDTVENQRGDDNIRFAKRTESFNDKYKRAWVYAGGVILALIVVFGLFFFLGSSDDNNATSNFTEQNYEDVEDDIDDDSLLENDALIEKEEGDKDEPAEEYFEETTVTVEQPVSQPVVSQPAYVAPVKAKPVATKPVSKPIVKKSAPARKPTPAKPVKENVIYEETVVTPAPAPVKKVEIVENDMSTLDLARAKYVSEVLTGDKYLDVIDSVHENFFTLDDSSMLNELEGMINIWNMFRNATYDAYYENDYTLKPDVNYEQYANDEYILRLFTNAYYKFFEDVSNEFAMKYEYADTEAVDLYDNIEDELQILGRPLAKLSLLAKMYNSIQTLGGSDEVLALIKRRDDEPEDINVDEIEAELLPVNTETTYTYTEKTTTYVSDAATDSEEDNEDDIESADSDVEDYEEAEIIEDESEASDEEDDDLLVMDDDSSEEEEVSVVSEEEISTVPVMTVDDTEDEEITSNEEKSYTPEEKRAMLQNGIDMASSSLAAVQNAIDTINAGKSADVDEEEIVDSDDVEDEDEEEIANDDDSFEQDDEESELSSDEDNDFGDEYFEDDEDSEYSEADSDEVEV